MEGALQGERRGVGLLVAVVLLEMVEVVVLPNTSFVPDTGQITMKCRGFGAEKVFTEAMLREKIAHASESLNSPKAFSKGKRYKSQVRRRACS